MTDLPSLLGSDAKVIARAMLSDYTTFRLGGPCSALILCQKPEELEYVVGRLVAQNIPFILIGGGSNLVVSDKGLDCVVIRYVTDKPMVQSDGENVLVSGSTLLDDLALYAVKNSLEGLNCTTGIPGTVGGAVVGNAGAFGKQVGDTLAAVTLLTKKGKKHTVEPSALEFNYRHSNLKESEDIVLSVRFRLSAGNREALEKERQEILNIRHEKHPDLNVHPCAGSFFKNIEPTSKAERRQAAGWFLEQAGVKAMRVGGAAIFEKHANIIVKSSGCVSQNVFDLSCLMAKAVEEKFGLSLVREVRFVGDFLGRPESVKAAMW